MKPIVWMSDAPARVVTQHLGGDVVVASSARNFLEAARDTRTVSFVDDTTIAELDDTPAGPVVMICQGSLQNAIGWLPTRPWLSHVVSASMISQPFGRTHLANVISTLTRSGTPRLLDWVGADVNARRVRLAHSNKRADRLDRMSEFFEAGGVGSRTIAQLRDVAEELLTNAFYDAPVAAGTVRKPISRTQDVSLPEDSACDMVYGTQGDLAIIRVRDPFGALPRSRLIDVLTRCARTDGGVEVDETMGGAGLGLWRIFSVASFLAISVVRDRRTEFLVGIRKRAAPGPKPFAFHLFFKRDSKPKRKWQSSEVETVDPALERSITIQSK